ncbi:glycosyltransferase [Cetobacterium sp.]|uniref:glycosyltransferase n=1 Tax=Cetobacterium sp. TaxID=2071632 RepID=UPI002FC94194
MKNLVIRSGSLRMGGLERVLIEMLQNLDRKKYNISLIIEDNSGEENVFLDQVPKGIDIYFLKSEELIANTHYHRERKKNLYNKLMYNYLMGKEHRIVVSKTCEVLQAIKEKHGDIDVFLDYDWGARRYVEKLDAKKKIVWIHNSIPKLLKKESKIKRFGKNLNKYDVVVAICDDMKKEIQEIYPYLKDKVERVYNPFNFKRILELSENYSALTDEQKLFIKEDYIVAVSRLDTIQKDYDTLLKGYKLAIEKGLKEKLFIIGDGPDRKKIEELIKENSLEEKVKLMGRTTNPYVWMKNSKLFVHSSNYEGFGLVIVEAAILGKAIISSDCKVGPKEILGNGKYGKVFPVGDFNSFSKILLNILSDSSEKEKFERAALLRAEDFRADKIMREYETIIGL